MKNNIQRKILWVVTISLIMITIAISYWRNCNTQSQINETETQVVQLAKKAHQVKYETAEVEIAGVITRMKNKQTNVDIERVFNDFKKTWKERGDTLTAAESENFVKKLSGFYKLQEYKYTYESNNQLLALVIILFIVGTFFCLTVFSNILRDITGDPVPREIETRYRMNALRDSSDAPLETVNPPFSLSRTQLAVWIAIIGSVYSYAVFWDARELIGINSTALLLMGISGGTFAVGAILDTVEIDEQKTRHQDVYTKSNFFKDILSDSNGVSIHRFQMVVWTVIAIFVYFYKYSNIPKGSTDTLPELDQTLLALTGISSATYLMLKARENISQSKRINLKINLEIDDSVPQKAAIIGNPDGLKQTSIDVINSKGDIAHATSDSAEPRFSFVAVIEANKLYKLEAKWKGTVSGDEIILVGSGLIEEGKEIKTIKLLMKLQS